MDDKSIYVLDSKFETVSIMDAYVSLIWNEKFYGTSEFELTVSANLFNVAVFKLDRYLSLKNTNTLMVIESIEIKSDSESGAWLVVKGRSLVSVLDRRVVYRADVNSTSTIQSLVKSILTDNAIAPTDNKLGNRKIPNLEFKDISKTPINANKVGVFEIEPSDILTIITEICSSANIGFKLEMDNNKKLIFSLYSGENRSYYQNKNDYVIFAPKFDNIHSSIYNKSITNYKTVGITCPKIISNVGVINTSNSGIGLSRREMLIKMDDSISYSKAEFLIKSSAIDVVLDAEIDISQSPIYKKDFFMGDIVQIEDIYGTESTLRVVEFIRSYDESGFSEYPKFIKHLE